MTSHRSHVGPRVVNRDLVSHVAHSIRQRDLITLAVDEDDLAVARAGDVNSDHPNYSSRFAILVTL